MNYNGRMAAIMEADLKRRHEREQEELRKLGLLDSDYVQSRNITGEPTDKHRVHRASDDCWKRGLRGRTVGIAPDTEVTGIATVRVIHADGTTEIRTANSFRTKNIATKQRQHTSNRKVSEIERMASTIGYIGNVE